VIDFDNLTSYERMISEIPDLQTAYRVKTRKGYHIYFSYDKRLKSCADAFILRGVDIRNDGGCIIAPPSSYTCKGETYYYEEIEGEIIPIPTALLAYVKPSVWDTSHSVPETSLVVTSTAVVATTTSSFASLVSLLSPERAGPYEDWSRVGFGIKNVLGMEGLDLFLSFSQQSPKFTAKDCIHFYHNVKRRASDKKITEKTFHFWAKRDNPEGYAKLYPKPADPYLAHKEQFEETHFYMEKSNTVVRIEKSGELSHFGLEHAKIALNQLKLQEGEKTKDFIEKWIKDANRRTIRHFVAKMPEDCAEDEYSLFRGFAYQHIEALPTAEQRTKAVALFHDLLRSICGDEEPVFEHVLKLMAHMIQRPLTKTNVLVAFASPVEGTGKDTVMGIIERIIGRSHVAHYTDTEVFWEKHDTNREGAIFVYLEEACAHLNKSKDGQLKALVTSSEINMNRKGQKSYTVPNLCNLWMTTNEPEPFKVGEYNRRGFLITPSARGTMRDWSVVYQVIHKEWFLRSIGEHLEEVDLERWITTAYPITEVKKEMMALAKSSEKEFFEQWKTHEELTGTQLFHAYRDYCVTNDLPHAQNAISFGKRIIILKDKHYIRRIYEGKNVYQPMGGLTPEGGGGGKK
jgi:hypothetical protein